MASGSPFARTLVLAARSGDDALARRAADALLEHLARTGRRKLLPSILREVREQAARAEKAAPVVEVASAGESQKAREAAEAEGIAAPHARVNHSLIRGWRARGRGVLVDRSAKRALIDIYQNVSG